MSLIDKCDVCGKKRSEHSISAGIPICPGIFAPTYKNSLGAQLEAMQAEIDRLRADNERLAGWLYEACGGFKVSDEAMSRVEALPQDLTRGGPFFSLDQFRQRVASLDRQGK